MSIDPSECRYLIRFDDICPTMNWAGWDAIESLLMRHSIRPILAVVPDNRDPKLIVDSPCADFWERVRKWQRAGYAIALHGYQHRYVNQQCRPDAPEPPKRICRLITQRAGGQVTQRIGDFREAWGSCGCLGGACSFVRSNNRRVARGSWRFGDQRRVVALAIHRCSRRHLGATAALGCLPSEAGGHMDRLLSSQRLDATQD